MNGPRRCAFEERNPGRAAHPRNAPDARPQIRGTERDLFHGIAEQRYEIKLVRVKGEFVWHTHEDTDELFLVLDGVLTIQLRDGDVTLQTGQLYVVPRGVEHCPKADGEVRAMLIEPTGVTNTGDAGGELTAEYDDSLAN